MYQEELTSKTIQLLKFINSTTRKSGRSSQMTDEKTRISNSKQFFHRTSREREDHKNHQVMAVNLPKLKFQSKSKPSLPIHMGNSYLDALSSLSQTTLFPFLKMSGSSYTKGQISSVWSLVPGALQLLPLYLYVNFLVSWKPPAKRIGFFFP